MLSLFITGNLILSCNEMSILSIDLSNINLNNIDYKEDHAETIIYVRILVWHSKFEKSKVLKKELNKELKPAPWHPR